MRRILALLLIMILIPAGPLWSMNAGTSIRAEKERPPLKPMSRATVRTLSLLPINAPVWFLGHRPIVGTLNALVQATGLAFGTWGAVGYIQLKGEDCSAAGQLAGLCGGLNGLGKGIATGLMIEGFGIWAVSYIITAVRGPHRVEMERELVSNRLRPQWQLAPIATPNGGGVGMTGRW